MEDSSGIGFGSCFRCNTANSLPRHHVWNAEKQSGRRRARNLSPLGPALPAWKRYKVSAVCCCGLGHKSNYSRTQVRTEVWKTVYRSERCRQRTAVFCFCDMASFLRSRGYPPFSDRKPPRHPHLWKPDFYLRLFHLRPLRLLFFKKKGRHRTFLWKRKVGKRNFGNWFVQTL